MKYIAWALLSLLLCATFVCRTASAQGRGGSRTTKLLAEFESKKRKVLVEAGHRHLELGLWCRNKGLVAQASVEFIRAVEVSEHRHPGAERVLTIMRSLGDDFWKKRRRTTHMGLLGQYEKRHAKATRKGQKARYDLAKWAYSRELEVGGQEFLHLLELNDAALEFDKKGRLVIPAGSLPLELSEQVREAAITINGRLWLRDEFLASLPDVAAIHEVEGDRIRVRSLVSLEQAQAVHDGCQALLPVLTEDTHSRPGRLMNVFVFAESSTYESYLEVSEMLAYKNAWGVALGGAHMALVNAAGRSAEETLGIALHEVSHLFMYGSTRSRMPSWYAEGFAETYGGQGCYEWRDGVLAAHGVMAEFRTAPLKTESGYIPLRTMLTSDALQLLGTDPEGSSVFYAQAWAFVRFLRREAGDETRERFELWEDMCRGKALGAVFDRPTEQGDAAPAQELFEEFFGAEFDELEEAFQAYLQTL